MLKMMGKKMFTVLHSKFCLSKPLIYMEVFYEGTAMYLNNSSLVNYTKWRFVTGSIINYT